jgi:ATP adenylyltransferase
MYKKKTIDILWRPWRMSYVKAATKKTKKCIFCEKMKESEDEKNFILRRSRCSFLILNIYPYNNGHIMCVTKRHVDTLEKLTREELMDLLENLIYGIKVLRRAFSPHGFNIGINLGKVAGAGIDKHLHIHIVPRWQGDTNFMPTVAECKVLPQMLSDTYTILKKLLSRVVK